MRKKPARPVAWLLAGLAGAEPARSTTVKKDNRPRVEVASAWTPLQHGDLLNAAKTENLGRSRITSQPASRRPW